jgi:hypothetical protein
MDTLEHTVEKEKPKYEKPQIKTYTEDQILDLIGPANTCGSPYGGGYHPRPRHHRGC